MPEGPELRLAANFVNGVSANHLFTGKVVRSEVATKLPEVPFEAETFRLSAESRGKELKVYLAPCDDGSKKKVKKKPPSLSENLSDVKHLLFRFGMSGCFKFTAVEDIPKHAHLRFFTKTGDKVLSYVDYRRFGSWTINGDWGSDRGPDPITDYVDFRQNVLDNLDDDDSSFKKPICEVLLNQKYFNGIGNYLRAEILYRCKVPPFARAKTVLQPLKAKNKVKSEEPDLLELCHIVPKEVLSIGNGSGYVVDPDPEDRAAFVNWLRCYYKEDMDNLVDTNGRTIWFSGPAGELRPANARSRGRKKAAASKKKNSVVDDEKEMNGEGQDVSCKKAKKATKAKDRKEGLLVEASEINDQSGGSSSRLRSGRRTKKRMPLVKDEK